MTDERQAGLLFESWLRDTDPMPPDARPSVAQVMGRVPQVRQRGRWWPLPAFDRPVSATPVRDPAPASIPATSGHASARGFTMFSAVKFVVAGVIVALVGGFLLAGLVPTRPGDEIVPAAMSAAPSTEATGEPSEAPSTSVRSDILPGVALGVEEVEPGVYRVLDDGVRELASANNTHIVAGHDGGVWLLRLRRFLRLGGDTEQKWTTNRPEVKDFDVAPDGTVWTAQDASIQSFDGEEWTLEKAAMMTFLDVTPDGTVWASWEDQNPEPLQVLAYLDEDGWQTLGRLKLLHRLLVAGHDDIWARAGWIFAPSPLFRFADDTWQRFVSIEGEEATWETWQQSEDAAPGEGDLWGLGMDLGSDGTFWGVSGDRIRRFDGDQWREWPLRNPKRQPMAVSVAPDGSVWLGFWYNARGKPVCKDGVGHFDGVTWDYYLHDLCVRSMDVDGGGSVWVLGDDGDLYVITPEAMAVSAGLG